MCGKCCGNIPFDPKIWEEIKGKAQKPYKLRQSEFIIVVHILPITEDGYCVFLKDDKTCAIYERRPYVCRLQGTVRALPCGNIDIGT
jgi:Fe-S-cluster containining protein